METLVFKEEKCFKDGKIAEQDKKLLRKTNILKRLILLPKVVKYCPELTYQGSFEEKEDNTRQRPKSPR